MVSSAIDFVRCPHLNTYFPDSGLIIFKLIEGTLAHSDVRVEVLMDDMVFPSYSSSKARSKHTQFGESKRDLCNLTHPHILISLM